MVYVVSGQEVHPVMGPLTCAFCPMCWRVPVSSELRRSVEQAQWVAEEVPWLAEQAQCVVEVPWAAEQAQWVEEEVPWSAEQA